MHHINENREKRNNNTHQQQFLQSLFRTLFLLHFRLFSHTYIKCALLSQQILSTKIYFSEWLDYPHVITCLVNLLVLCLYIFNLWIDCFLFSTVCILYIFDSLSFPSVRFYFSLSIFLFLFLLCYCYVFHVPSLPYAFKCLYTILCVLLLFSTMLYYIWLQNSMTLLLSCGAARSCRK